MKDINTPDRNSNSLFIEMFFTIFFIGTHSLKIVSCLWSTFPFLLITTPVDTVSCELCLYSAVMVSIPVSSLQGNTLYFSRNYLLTCSGILTLVKLYCKVFTLWVSLKIFAHMKVPVDNLGMCLLFFQVPRMM